MTSWMRRVRGALGMGAVWAGAWALAGILIGVGSTLLPFLPWDAFFAFYDAPLPTLAIPGFVGGTLFSLVLGVAARRRRFDELSVPRVAAWGALGGALASLLPAALVGLGLATIGRNGAGVWQLTAIISGPLVLLSAGSAAGSLAIARRGSGIARIAVGRYPESAGPPRSTSPDVRVTPDPSP